MARAEDGSLPTRGRSFVANQFSLWAESRLAEPRKRAFALAAKHPYWKLRCFSAAIHIPHVIFSVQEQKRSRIKLVAIATCCIFGLTSL